LFAIYAVVNLVLTASLRASYVILENSKLRSSHEGLPVLIYGAGRGGVAAVRELFHNQTCGLRPVGFIDDDPEKKGKVISGLPVIASIREINDALRMTSAEGVVISTDTISPERIDRADEACRTAGGNLFRMDIVVKRIRDEAVVPAASNASPLFHQGEPALAVAVRFDEAAAAPGSQPCPSCRVGVAHRSKARNAYERFWKKRTYERLFRCEKCRWRGWMTPMGSVSIGDVSGPPSVDLGRLDTHVPMAAPLASASFSAGDLN